MKTKKSKFDGLVVKFNDYLKTGIHDCDLCCLKHSDACEHCPLVDVNCYFVNPSVSSSKMSSVDVRKIDSVIDDLEWLSKHLRDSERLHLLSSACVELAKTILDCCISRLNRIITFDK